MQKARLFRSNKTKAGPDISKYARTIFRLYSGFGRKCMNEETFWGLLLQSNAMDRKYNVRA